MPERDTTYDRAVAFLQGELTNEEIPAALLFEKAAAMDISARTLKKAKAALDIRSFKRENQWFWVLPYQQ